MQKRSRSINENSKQGRIWPKPMAIATCVGRGSTSASGTLTTLCRACTTALMMSTTCCPAACSATG